MKMDRKNLILETGHKELFITNIYLLCHSINLLWSITQQLTGLENDETIYEMDDYDKSLLKTLYKFSVLDPPYHRITSGQRKDIGIEPKILNNWRTPNPELVYRVYYIHRILKDQKYKSSDFYAHCGFNNIWIAKQYLKSQDKQEIAGKLQLSEQTGRQDNNAKNRIKGTPRQPTNNPTDSTSKTTKNILVTNNLPQLVKFLSENPETEVCVQKYIEDPITYELIDFSSVENSVNKIKKGKYKIDFRQWIFIKQSRPLEIYMLSNYYACVSKKPFTKSEQFLDRKSTRLNSSHVSQSRMPSSA